MTKCYVGIFLKYSIQIDLFLFQHIIMNCHIINIKEVNVRVRFLLYIYPSYVIIFFERRTLIKLDLKNKFQWKLDLIPNIFLGVTKLRND